MPKFAAQSASVAAVALAFVFVAGSASDAHAKRPRGADLTVRSLVAPAAVVRGATFRFVFTVANNGAGTAKRSKVRAVLARDTRKGRGDVRLLGAKSIPPLAPGAMARETGTARVPPRAGTGQWSLIVCAAAERDGNSRNNCRRSSRRTTVWKYPDASNTGPTGSLTESTGNITVSTPGTVIQNRKIKGCLRIRASNVTIRNAEINCDGPSAVWSGSTGLLVEDTEIECGHRPGQTGLTSANYTVRRSELFGCENIIWAERNVVIEDSYLHDPIPCCRWPEPKPHTDSIQIPTGAVNIRVKNNRVYGGYIDQSDFGNAALTMGGNVGGVVVDNNIFAGGGYTVYCEHENVGGNGSPPLQVTNNRFSRVFVSKVGGFGPSAECSDDIQWGNVYHEAGEPLNLR
jgi:hypothetical protein